MRFNFNLSPSSLTNWHTSQILFFLQQIAKAKPDTIVNSSYSTSGTISHESIEYYINNKDKQKAIEFFHQQWDSKMFNKLGFNKKPLSKQQYYDAFERGCHMVDNKYDVEISEMEIIIPSGREGCNFKGYIDLVAKENGIKKIVDWKTSSSKDSGVNFRNQVLMYAFLYWKKTGEIINHASIEYIKIDKVSDFEFSDEEVTTFDKRVLYPILDDIERKGAVIDFYDFGEWNHPFCAYKRAITGEMFKRNNPQSLNILRKDNKMVFAHGICDDLAKRLDNIFKYRIKDAHFNSAVKAGGWNGDIKFLKKDRHGIYSLPFAFYNLFTELLAKFNQMSNTNYKINMTDARHDSVVNLKLNTKFKEPPFNLRPYQEEAIKVMLDKKVMILYGGTSYGKTVTSAEFIKRVNQRSLIVVNRIELVRQTIEEYENYLGVEIGDISEGKMDISKQISVCSIQTIHAILKRDNEESKQLRAYLFNVNVVMWDECHGVTRGGMYGELGNLLVNATYVVGMSGSPQRNDTKDALEMSSVVGFVEYSKPTTELIAEGYNCPVNTYFISVPARDFQTQFTEFNEMVEHSITNHEGRNKLIAEIIEKFRSTKKIIIATNRISHGEILEKLIPNSYFLNGSTPKKERKEIFRRFKEEGGFVLISMVQIISTGVNVPDLDMIISCAVYKSENMSCQTVGRIMRKGDPSKKMAVFLDFDDQHEHFSKFSRKRMKSLKMYGHEIKKIKEIEEIKFE